MSAKVGGGPLTQKPGVRRVSILGVKGIAVGAALAAAVAVPLGLATLPAADPLPDAQLPRPPQWAEASDAAPEAAERASEVLANRKSVGRLRSLSREELTEVVREGSQVEQLGALHLLFVRGHREHVETLVSASGDKAFEAKLAALRSRSK